MRAGYIYSLNEPITNVPRYIGYTFYLKNRKKDHFKALDKTHKGNWIRKLKSQGLLPVMEIIDEVCENEIKFWEQHYISLYKSWGFKLTNGTIGGDGTLGYKYSKEQIDNLVRIKRERGVYVSGIAKTTIANRLNGTHERAKEKMRISNPMQRKGIIGTAHTGTLPILQYSSNGKFIKEWNSAKEASVALNIPRGNITHCCKGRLAISYGFQWRYKVNDNYNKSISPYFRIRKKINNIK